QQRRLTLLPYTTLFRSAQVLEARRLLEPGVARLAAQRAGDEDFAAMARTIADQRALVDEGAILAEGREDRFLALDVRFHLTMARSEEHTSELQSRSDLV